MRGKISGGGNRLRMAAGQGKGREMAGEEEKKC